MRRVRPMAGSDEEAAGYGSSTRRTVPPRPATGPDLGKEATEPSGGPGLDWARHHMSFFICF